MLISDPASVGFTLTPKQLEQRAAAASTATHVLAFGGSRSGKTFGFCRCVATRALSAPESRHLIARLQNIDVRQAVMMDTWPNMMRKCFPHVPYEINRSDQYVTLGDGAEVWFGGLDDKERVEKILGKEYATIYPNETSQIAYETILMLRTRLAQKVSKKNGRPLALKAYYDLNPTGRSHWTYQEFVLGLVPGTTQALAAGSRAFVQMNPEDNPHLPAGYLEELNAMPERFRQRFKDGNYLNEVPGTLWPLDNIDAVRVSKPVELMRIVVSVDPSGSDGVGGDRQGIMVVGEGVDGNAYVLEDASCRMSPAGWGSRAAALYDKYEADLIVAEANYGGAMVESTIRSAHPTAKVKLVHASRGKHIRAEPVAALYESVRDTTGAVIKAATVRHVGRFPELEEQMAAFTTSGYQGSGSPDRVDALVWALTELMLEERPVAAMFLTGNRR
jgi:phage terminase large subunit-like protein